MIIINSTENNLKNYSCVYIHVKTNNRNTSIFRLLLIAFTRCKTGQFWQNKCKIFLFLKMGSK